MSDTFFNSESGISIIFNGNYSDAFSGPITLLYSKFGNQISIEFNDVNGVPSIPSLATVSFILPIEIRPFQDLNFPYLCTNNGTNQIGIFQVKTNGSLFWYGDVNLGQFTGPSNCAIFAKSINFII